MVTTLGFPARLAGRGRVRGARGEETGTGRVARSTPRGLTELRPLHGPPRDPPWGRAGPSGGKVLTRRVSAGTGAGGEARSLSLARSFAGGPPPGSPLDPHLGAAPTSGAVGDRALTRVGSARESNWLALRDSGVASEHPTPFSRQRAEAPLSRPRPRPAALTSSPAALVLPAPPRRPRSAAPAPPAPLSRPRPLEKKKARGRREETGV